MEYRMCQSILSADYNRLGEQIKILEREILICSPSRLKSADKIDGHNRYSMTQYLLFSFNS